MTASLQCDRVSATKIANPSLRASTRLAAYLHLAPRLRRQFGLPPQLVFLQKKRSKKPEEKSKSDSDSVPPRRTWSGKPVASRGARRGSGGLQKAKALTHCGSSCLVVRRRAHNNSPTPAGVTPRPSGLVNKKASRRPVIDLPCCCGWNLAFSASRRPFHLPRPPPRPRIPPDQHSLKRAH